LGLFLAIAPLAVFGGPALHEFAIVLLFGLVLATSSSIFIAAPILLNLGEKRFGVSRPLHSSGLSIPATHSGTGAQMAARSRKPDRPSLQSP
jgi:SecD/SecF fusion protein